MKTYRVEVGFAGFYGVSQTYEVDADSREEAEELALEEARYDLSIEEIDEDEEE